MPEYIIDQYIPDITERFPEGFRKIWDEEDEELYEDFDEYEDSDTNLD